MPELGRLSTVHISTDKPRMHLSPPEQSGFPNPNPSSPLHVLEQSSSLSGMNTGGVQTETESSIAQTKVERTV